MKQLDSTGNYTQIVYHWQTPDCPMDASQVNFFSSHFHSQNKSNQKDAATFGILPVGCHVNIVVVANYAAYVRPIEWCFHSLLQVNERKKAMLSGIIIMTMVEVAFMYIRLKKTGQ